MIHNILLSFLNFFFIFNCIFQYIVDFWLKSEIFVLNMITTFYFFDDFTTTTIICHYYWSSTHYAFKWVPNQKFRLNQVNNISESNNASFLSLPYMGPKKTLLLIPNLSIKRLNFIISSIRTNNYE